jgi:hypothetical protein
VFGSRTCPSIHRLSPNYSYSGVASLNAHLDLLQRFKQVADEALRSESR